MPGNAVEKLATCELCTDRYWCIVANGREMIPGGVWRRYRERKRWKQVTTQTEVRWSITDGNFVVRQSTGCWQTDDQFVWPLSKNLHSPNLTSHYNTGCFKIIIMDITARHPEVHINVVGRDVFIASSFLLGWENKSLDWLLTTFRNDAFPLSSWAEAKKLVLRIPDPKPRHSHSRPKRRQCNCLLWSLYRSLADRYLNCQAHKNCNQSPEVATSNSIYSQ